MASTTIDILATFGFTTPEKVTALSVLLRETRGFIAGGAALYWFLGECSPTDQDLDIWIPTHTRRNPDYIDDYTHYPETPDNYKAVALTTLADGSPDPACYEYDASLMNRVTTFMTVMGYSSIMCSGARHSYETEGGTRRNMDIPYHTNPEFKRIVRRIMDFRNGGRKIQVILYYGDTEPLSGFDLDICQISVRPTEEGGFAVQLPAGLYEAEVRAKRMRITNTSCPSNLERRLEKYYARGFRVISCDVELS